MWFPVNFAKLVWRQKTKGECLQMFPKKVYICFVYIFFSPQVKRSVIISNKYGIYELPRKLANELKYDGFCSPYKDKLQYSGSSEIRKDQENIKTL